jgi:hypothetical protein
LLREVCDGLLDFNSVQGDSLPREHRGLWA